MSPLRGVLNPQQRLCVGPFLRLSVVLVTVVVAVGVDCVVDVDFEVSCG